MIISTNDEGGGGKLTTDSTDGTDGKPKMSMKIAIVFQATGDALDISLVRLDWNKNLPQVTNDHALKAALNVFAGIVKRHQKTAGGAK